MYPSPVTAAAADVHRLENSFKIISDDERLSTVQLKLNQRQDGGYHWTIYEHRALQNSTPSTQAQVLVRELLVTLQQLSQDELCRLYKKQAPQAPEPDAPRIDYALLATERTVMVHAYLHKQLEPWIAGAQAI